MLAIALFSWWYTTAWAALGRRIERRLDQSLDFFSVGLLLRTLFDPFRQIAAVKGHGSLDVQMRAWADRTFSRFFGAFVRTLFIIIGVVVSAIIMIIGGVQMILWPCVPLLPVIAIVGYVMGWAV